jgi:uncharacterized protein DUF899
MITSPESDRKGGQIAMHTPPTVSPQEWEAAREQRLMKEKTLTRARDALTAERRRMPWLAVAKECAFDGPKGKASLLDSFDGRRQLIVYRAESRDLAALRVADWLCLAAAPTFAMMALLTGVLGGGAADMLCLAAHDASPLSGMVPMYLLMSTFHLTPWLKLVSRTRRRARRADSVRRGDHPQRAHAPRRRIPPHLSLPPFDARS